MANTTIDKRTFLGGLDTDNDYYYALNIRNLSSEDGTVGVVENIKGMRDVGYNFPTLQLGQNQISYFYVTPVNGSVSSDLLLSLGSTTYNMGSAFTLFSSADVSTPALIEALFNTFVTTWAGILDSSAYDITVTVVSNYTTVAGVSLPALKFEGQNYGAAFGIDSSADYHKVDIEQLATSGGSQSVNYKCIGTYEDTKDDKIYYFVCSLGDAFLHHILEYDLQSNTIATVFRDTGQAWSSMFKWMEFYLITDINKIGDVLYWTQERYGEPRSINVKKGKNTFTSFNTAGAAGNYTPLTDYYPYAFVDPTLSTERKVEYTEVIKRAPVNKPTYIFQDDSNYKKNNLHGSSWQFKYRYHYYDKEVSPWSPVSDIRAPWNLYLNNLSETNNTSSKDNKIQVTFRNSIGLVEHIEVAARKCKDFDNVPIGNRGDFFSIAKISNIFSIGNASLPKTQYSTQTINFYNDKVYTFLDATDSNKLFDAVPKKAKTQTIIGDNRLAYGNYTEGFDLPDIDISLTPKFLQESDDMAVILYPFWTSRRDSMTLPGTYDTDGGSTPFVEDYGGYNIAGSYDLTSASNPLLNTGLQLFTDTAHTIPDYDAQGIQVVMDEKVHTVNRSTEYFRGSGTGQGNIEPKEKQADNPLLESSSVTNVFGQGPGLNNIGYYTASTAGGSSAYPKIRFAYNVKSLVWKQGATIKIEYDFKFRVRHEKYAAAQTEDRHGPEQIGSFSFTVNCPASLATVAEQMDYVAEQLTNESIGGKKYYNNPNNKPEGEDAWQDKPIYDHDRETLIFTWVAKKKNNINSIAQNSEFRLVTSKEGYGFLINADTGDRNNDSSLNANNTAKLTYMAGNIGHRSSTFKTGAFHSFGLVYYDDAGRCSTVALDEGSQTYVKFPTEREYPGDAVDPTSGNQDDAYGQCNINWQINHDPPSWAKYYKWAYARNTSVDEFVQFIADDVKANESDASDKRIFLSLNSLKGRNYSYKEKNNPLIDYKYVEGDRIRFIKKGTDREFFGQYIDVRITGMDYYNNGGTGGVDLDEDVPIGTSGTAAKGYFVHFQELDMSGFKRTDVINDTDVYTNCFFEIYRPKKEGDKEQLIYYEFGELYDVVGNVNNKTHSVTAGVFDIGDVYYKPRIMLSGIADVAEFVEDYYLNDFYETNHFNIGRANAYTPYAKEERKVASITYSEPYQPDINYNGLSTFNSANTNYMTYNRIDGSIQKIFSRDADLVMIQEDRTHRILVNKDIIVDAAGDGNVGLSSNVLSNTTTPYWGQYGISKNPESFVANGNVLYWVDIKRGAVLRLSRDGFTVISNINMIDYFNDKSTLYQAYDPEFGFFNTDDEFTPGHLQFRILGGFNPKHNEYVISFPKVITVASAWNNIGDYYNNVSTYYNNMNPNTMSDLTIVEGQTIVWAEPINRWMSFMSFMPDMYSKINRQFVSFEDGTLYLHDNSTDYNNFYGIYYHTKISVPFNGIPSAVKAYKAFSIEGNQALETSSSGVNEASDTAYNVTLITNLSSTSIDRNNFDEREGIQYTQIPFCTGTTTGGEAFGVGTCTTSSSSTTVTGTNFTTLNLLIGDVIYYNDSGTNTVVGTIQTINSNTSITLAANATVTLGGAGTFLYVLRSGFAEGDRLKGSYMTADLSKLSREKLEIFAINAVVNKTELNNR